MFLLRPAVVTEIFRSRGFRPNKLFESDQFVLQLKTLSVLTKQLPDQFENAKRSFCRLAKHRENDDQIGNDFANDLIGKENKEEIFQQISKGDQDVLNSLKSLDYEIAFLRNIGMRVPHCLSRKHWEELVQEQSPSKRKKLLAFFRLNELKQMSSQKKAQIRCAVAVREKEEAGFHYYGMGGHSMFLRVYDKTINRLLALRSQAYPGLKIVFDCSYEEYMNKINTKACAKQIGLCMYESRFHQQRSQLSLCNLSKDSQLGKILPNHAPVVFNKLFGPDIYEENYLDVFPKEKLVYLTPHSQEDLVFDPDDIYVIGAFVDKGTGLKVSLAKAKSAQIRYARFPLDKYLSWKQGTKSLPLNIVVKILLELGFQNDWNRAFQHIPHRCVKEHSPVYEIY